MTSNRDWRSEYLIMCVSSVMYGIAWVLVGVNLFMLGVSQQLKWWTSVLGWAVLLMQVLTLASWKMEGIKLCLQTRIDNFISIMVSASLFLVAPPEYYTALNASLLLIPLFYPLHFILTTQIPLPQKPTMWVKLHLIILTLGYMAIMLLNLYNSMGPNNSYLFYSCLIAQSLLIYSYIPLRKESEQEISMLEKV